MRYFHYFHNTLCFLLTFLNMLFSFLLFSFLFGINHIREIEKTTHSNIWRVNGVLMDEKSVNDRFSFL